VRLDGDGLGRTVRDARLRLGRRVARETKRYVVRPQVFDDSSEHQHESRGSDSRANRLALPNVTGGLVDDAMS
jgi:hypothetical protein